MERNEELLLNFIAKYNAMRETQKSYFGAKKAGSPKTQGILIRSKQLERELDEEVKNALEELKGKEVRV